MNRTGTLTIVAGRSVLRFERRYRHPVEKVWRATTEPGHLARWFPTDVRMDLHVGARAMRSIRRAATWCASSAS